MGDRRRGLFVRLVLMAPLALIAPPAAAQDADGDGVSDSNDNCPTLYNPNQDGGTVKLNGPLVPGGAILGAWLSPDSSSVVYLADQDTLNIFHLYSVPIEGGTATNLHPGVGWIRSPGDLQISRDGTRVVFTAERDTAFINELYSVPIAGGTMTKLNPTLTAGGEVFEFSVASDSGRVVYRADQDTDNRYELYSVPIAGGTATKLHPDLGPLGREVMDNWALSPDASTVVFRGDLDTKFVSEIYSVPIAGGAVTKLNPPLPVGRHVGGLEISPDSARVVYLADQDIDNVSEVFSVPIGGGAVTKLNPAFPAGRSANINIRSISPDSAWVVYRADQDTDNDTELYSVPITGGASTKLNKPLLPSRDIIGAPAFSPDSTRVVYRADHEIAFTMELYSVPIAGGSVTKLNPPFPADRDVELFTISGDSAWVVYSADQVTNDVGGVFSVPIVGGVATQLNTPLPSGGSLSVFGSISPESDYAKYMVDQDIAGVLEGFVVPIEGGASRKLHPALPAGRSLNALGSSADWRRVVYFADQDTDDLFELYSSAMVIDGDGDGIFGYCDCLDSDPAASAVPGEPLDVSFGVDKRTLSWSAPASSGGTTVLYDTLRSDDPASFTALGSCVETNDGADTSAVDVAIPPAGQFFAYLVRAENACGAGTLGADSTGTARQGLTCP